MLKPGDIVTDLDHESVYYEKQGEVVGVQLRFWEFPEVIVKFDRIFYPFYIPSDEEDAYVYASYDGFDELRLDLDWKPEMYAQRIFGDCWHHVRNLSEPLNSQKLCMRRDCSNHQARVIWVNEQGLVSNVYVCDEHAEYYRTFRYMDAFPHRRDIA